MRTAHEDLKEVSTILNGHLNVLLRMPELNPKNNPRTQKILDEALKVLSQAAKDLTTPELTIFLFSITAVWVETLILVAEKIQASNQN